MDERIRRIIQLMEDRASIGEPGLDAMYGSDATGAVGQLADTVMDRLRRTSPDDPAVRRFESSPTYHGQAVMELLSRQIKADAAFATEIWRLYDEVGANTGMLDAVSTTRTFRDVDSVDAADFENKTASLDASTDAMSDARADGYGPPPGPPTIPDKPI